MKSGRLGRDAVFAALVATATALATPALAAQGTADEYEDTHPPAGVTVRERAGARLFEAVTPGPLLDWTFLRAGDDAALFLLVAPEAEGAEGRVLYRWTPGRAGERGAELTPVDVELPPEAASLAALDLDADGDGELLVGEPGRVWKAPAGFSAPLVPLAAAPGLDLDGRVPVRGGESGVTSLSLPTVDGLRRLAPGGAGATELPLQPSASRHLHGLRLTTPPSTLLRLAAGDLYAVGPEEVGDRRLRTTLLPLDGSPPREAWCRLPEPERVQWSWFHVLDGRPLLVVTTNSADKLGVLERQKLRVFSLHGDRTQAGVGPWLAARTTSRRWQRVETWVTDVDGDGDEDLAVAQYDGLGDGKIRLEVFVNAGGRRFEARTRSGVIDRPATSWHFGDDLTGDGLPDLVLLAEGEIEVYAGEPAERSRPVERKPRWGFTGDDIPRPDASVELGSGGVVVSDPRSSTIGVPRTLDLDGDGRLEIVLAENPRWGFGRLRVVFLPP